MIRYIVQNLQYNIYYSSNENDNFDDNEKEYVFKTNLLKYYLFENSNENFVKHRKINKIIHDKNNQNYIVFIKNYMNYN